MSTKRSQTSSIGDLGGHDSRDHQLLRTMKSLNYEKSPEKSGSRRTPLQDSAAKLRILLEKRQSSAKTLKDGSPQIDCIDQDTLAIDDLATLLNDSYDLTNHLEEQVQFYQDTVKMLRQRSEQVVRENEILYEKLKENLVSDVINDKQIKTCSSNKTQEYGSKLLQDKLHLEEHKEGEMFHVPYSKGSVEEIKTTTTSQKIPPTDHIFQDRQYFHQIEEEMDKVKRLNEEKTRRLEAILKSTRVELQEYRNQASNLQSRLRAYETESEQRYSGVCFQCQKKDHGIFKIPPSEAHTKTVSQLTRERDELMETLIKQKTFLTQCQQREFEAYVQVKKSVETVEQAQLEKAEVIIKIQQLRSSMEEERKRQENLLAKRQEKTKQELGDMKESYERKYVELNNKLQEQIQISYTTEHQLEKLSRDKVNLIAEVEKAKAEVMALKLDIAQVSQDTKEEIVQTTRQCVKAQQDFDNVKIIQARQLREHEKEKASLVTENEELRRRLCEAQDGWVESREECIQTLDKFKKLENEFHLATASKTNLEKARNESAAFFKKQEEERERHFLGILEGKEKEYVILRKELQEMLEAQMQITKMVKDESKKMAQKLENKAQKYRKDNQEWRHQHSQLTTKIETLLKQHEDISRKNNEDSKINRKLSSKVEFLKTENKKAMKTIYELLKKQNDLMQDRQNLSRQVEYLGFHDTKKVIKSGIPDQEILLKISPDECEKYDDDTLSNTKPINDDEHHTNVLDESL